MSFEHTSRKTLGRWFCCIIAITALASGCAKSGQISESAKTPKPLPYEVKANEIVVVEDRPDGRLTTVAPSTAEIQLSWPAMPDASTYIVCRNVQRKMPLVLFAPTTIAAESENRYVDTNVDRDTSYFYAVVAQLPGNRYMLIATGTGKTLAEDGPLIGIDSPPKDK